MSGFLSQFERKLRSFSQKIFHYLYRHQRPEPSVLGPVNRILLVRIDKIGDAIISTVLVAALRQRFPGVEIDMVLGRRNQAAAPLLPPLDNVFVARPNMREVIALIRKLRRRRYDVAIDLIMHDSMTAAVYTAATGARIKIGFKDATSTLYDFAIPLPLREHSVRRLLRLLAPLKIFVPDAEARPSTVLSPASLRAAEAALAGIGRPLLMINISGSSAHKFWGADNFVRLASDLRKTGAAVILMSAPEDQLLLKEIADRSGVPHLSRPGLMDFAALLWFADLVISPDTSIVHIAAAFNKPVVTLAESELVSIQWGPWGVPSRSVSSGRSIPEIPCSAVVSAVQSLMSEVMPDFPPAEQARSPSQQRDRF